jgi:hypothetical protein
VIESEQRGKYLLTVQVRAGEAGNMKAEGGLFHQTTVAGPFRGSKAAEAEALALNMRVYNEILTKDAE